MNVPFILSTGFLTVGASANSAPADTTRLSSPFRKPLYVDEIHFLTMEAQAFGQGVGLFSQVQLAVGRAGITHGYVPIGVLAPSNQRRSDSEAGQATESATPSIYTTVRWVLPRPLLLLAGETLSASFQRIADGASVNVSVEMSLVCRAVPPLAMPPRERDVPWVCAYQNNKIGASVSQASGTSGTTLFNPFLRPLNVQRLVGRSYLDAGSGEFDWDTANGTVDLKIGTDANVEMSDSDRFPLVRDPTVFGEVFDVTRKAWTAPRVLDPKGWLRVRFSAAPTTRVYWIGMIGWRKEPLA